jgi:hypothetical protein
VHTLYNAETVAGVYKALWTVEGIIRITKSVMDTEPIYHRCNETIRGRVFCSFLALLLKTELERAPEVRELTVRMGAGHSWPRSIATGRGGFSGETLCSTEPACQPDFSGATGDRSLRTPHVARVVLTVRSSGHLVPKRCGAFISIALKATYIFEVLKTG